MQECEPVDYPRRGRGFARSGDSLGGGGVAAVFSRRGQFGALRCESLWLHPIQTVEFVVGHDAMISREPAGTARLAHPHADAVAYDRL